MFYQQKMQFEKEITRFAPSPTGRLHLGHAFSALFAQKEAEKRSGRVLLRMENIDKARCKTEYEAHIREDLRWLGFDWGDKLFHASDYFEALYQHAVTLIKSGKAYVCHLNEDEIRAYRGSVTEPGKPSPYRERSIEENLALFTEMRSGKFKDGECVLRARIDMAAANMKMRDPLLYRIRHVAHPRTGDAWPIYPMYDFAHCLSDAIEGITHSLCTLEFENNRELYDWILDQLDADIPCHPRQIEFARLNINYTVMSKRKLLDLVEGGYVDGWDDPRLPTITGLRRRGYTPESIRNFCESVGLAKSNSTVDMAQLEFCIRDDLNQKAPRVMAVLNPIKVVIENYPDASSEDCEEELNAPYFPHDVPLEGSRAVPFSRELYIERDDFMENPPKDFYRLAPGGEVRLRYAYCIKCERVEKDPKTGEVTTLYCTYDPETRSGQAPTDRKVKGTIHWVSAAHAVSAEVRLYDRLLSVESPASGKGKEFLESLNPDSLKILSDCKLEPSLASALPHDRFQFERQGYFSVDPVLTTNEKLVFNRIVSLKDSWAKQAEAPKAKEVAPVVKKEAANNNIIIEGRRALFFSKLLGLITNDTPFKATQILEEINNNADSLSTVISSQMEKLYFWNDIYSVTNRHATDLNLRNKQSTFSIYTIIFIYQILLGLYHLGEKARLSKFELAHFVFFAKNHDQYDQVLEHVMNYRNSKNIYEVEKFLKRAVRKDSKKEKYNIFDTRYFSILKHVEAFSCNQEEIWLKENTIHVIEEKVMKFDEIRKEKSIFFENDFQEYKEMLYSKKTFFDYFLNS